MINPKNATKYSTKANQPKNFLFRHNCFITKLRLIKINGKPYKNKYIPTTNANNARKNANGILLNPYTNKANPPKHKPAYNMIYNIALFANATVLFFISGLDFALLYAILASIK